MVGTQNDLLAEYLRVEASFPAFLEHVTIRDAKRGLVRMELWPHLLDLAQLMQSGESLLVGKGRQLGISWEIAIYDAWLLLFRDRIRILSISKGQEDSIELLGKVKIVLDHLPAWLQKKRYHDNETKISITHTGGEMLALPSTKNAGRSFDAMLVQVDEAAFHPYAGENYAAFHSAVADGGGQEIFITTGNGPQGLFYNLWRGLEDSEDLYTKRFYPWHARPDRGQEWYDREFARFLAVGDRHPSLFKRENPSSEQEMFETFFGQVFEMYDEDSHVVSSHPFDWEKAKWRVGAVDPGQGDNAAIGFYGEDDKGQAHKFGEFISPGVTSEQTIRSELLSWHRRAPFAGIAVDPHEGTLIATLNQNGLPAYPANTERGMGIGHVASRLEAFNYTIHASCKQTRHEYKTYRWKDQREAGGDPYLTSTPSDHHADTMDTDRYGLVWLSQFCSNTRRVNVSGPSYDGPKRVETLVTPNAKGEWTDKLAGAIAGGRKGHRPPMRRGPDYRRGSRPRRR